MSKPYVRPDVAAFLAAMEQSGAPPVNELPVAAARQYRWRWCAIWHVARFPCGFMTA